MRWAAPDLSFYRSVEFRTAVLAVICLLGVAGWVLDFYGKHSSSLLLDFREWTPDSSSLSRQPGTSIAQLREAFANIQTPLPEQRPFRLTLELDAMPQAGDYLSARRIVEADPDRKYCFSVLAYNERFSPETEGAAKVIAVTVEINDRIVASFPRNARGRGRRISADGIIPRRGSIEIRFTVKAVQTPEGVFRRQDSRVNFEYASLHPCRQSAAGQSR